MTPKERSETMIKACRSVGEWEGSQLKERPGDVAAVTIDFARLRAAAAVMRVLTNLRELSYSVKGLAPADIQACIDGFYEKAEIEEDREPMGQIIYKRKEKA